MNEFFTFSSLIKSWLDQHGVNNYEINSDLTVDVNSNVALSNKDC